MKRDRKKESSPRRGIRSLAFLAGAVVLAIGALLATVAATSQPSQPSTSRESHDSLFEAKLAFAEGDLDRAEELLRSVAGSAATPEAKILLGRVLLERGRPQEAQRFFGEVIKSDRESFHAVWGLSRVYQALGETDLAVVYLRRAAQLRKDDTGVVKALALLEQQSGMARKGKGARPGIPGLPAVPGMPGFDPRNPGAYTPSPRPPRPVSSASHLGFPDPQSGKRFP